jgi:hypothetical protein
VLRLARRELAPELPEAVLERRRHEARCWHSTGTRATTTAAQRAHSGGQLP